MGAPEENPQEPLNPEMGGGGTQGEILPRATELVQELKPKKKGCPPAQRMKLADYLKNFWGRDSRRARAAIHRRVGGKQPRQSVEDAIAEAQRACLDRYSERRSAPGKWLGLIIVCAGRWLRRLVAKESKAAREAVERANRYGGDGRAEDQRDDGVVAPGAPDYVEDRGRSLFADELREGLVRQFGERGVQFQSWSKVLNKVLYTTREEDLARGEGLRRAIQQLEPKWIECGVGIVGGILTVGHVSVYLCLRGMRVAPTRALLERSVEFWACCQAAKRCKHDGDALHVAHWLARNGIDLKEALEMVGLTNYNNARHQMQTFEKNLSAILADEEPSLEQLEALLDSSTD